MSTEYDQSHSVADFVARRCLREYYHPQGTVVQRFTTDKFYNHCSERGDLLPKPERVLKGYSGIIVAEFVLEPPKDVTDEYRYKLGLQEILVEGPVQRTKFELAFSAVGIEWMGIKHSGSDHWTTESTGLRLDRTPTVDNLISSFTDPDYSQHNLQISKKGDYLLAAGKFRDPQWVLRVDVETEGIKLVEQQSNL